MTQPLEKTSGEVAKLSESEQDAVAALILEELESEMRWSLSIAKSRERLAKLAEEALAGHDSGQTKPL